MFWILVLIMSCATYGTRTLPFLLGQKHRLLIWLGGENARLKALGPSLIAAIAAVTIVPDFINASKVEHNISEILVYVIGLATAVMITKCTKNSGLAVIIAMTTYGVVRFLFGL